MFTDAFQQLQDASPVPSLLELTLGLLAGAVLLFPLERRFAVQRLPLFRRGLWLDLGYWFFTPLFTRVFTGVLLIVVLLVSLQATGRALDRSMLDGHGPLSRQPVWLQILEILLLADFIDYWTHRTFHRTGFWRFHAIHHSIEEMSWLSSSRMHPINDAVTRVCQIIPIILLGFSLNAALIIVPALVFYVILLHSNLSWDFGPFRYLLVSPAYHRWHHTSDDEGVDKNFAGIFPIWDLLYGTCHFPRKRLPQKLGVRHHTVPETLWGQLLFPFRLGARNRASRTQRHPGLTPSVSRSG